MLAYGWTYRVTAPLDYNYYNWSSNIYHSTAGYMTTDYIMKQALDNIRVSGFRVQPNPSNHNLNFADNILDGDFPETVWQYISLETIEEAKIKSFEINDKSNNDSENIADIAQEMKIELTNGANNEVISTVSLEDYLRNTEFYKSLLKNEYDKAMFDNPIIE
ncbi:hypothetical protein KDN24_10635 [Bacillus sp. Bva_UNVM-123]|uniref:hypothetical protein n=1 Tax=Bacillus sp. Bva_UNVM-123 TaxID=2829798 RepID=UPI00391F1B68